MFGSRHKKSEFRYKPRYFDENMEDLKKRVRAIKQEMGEIEGGQIKPGSTIKGAFTAEREKKKSEEKSRIQKANIRLIVFLIALGYLAWIVLTTDYFHNLFEGFNKYLDGR